MLNESKTYLHRIAKFSHNELTIALALTSCSLNDVKQLLATRNGFGHNVQVSGIFERVQQLHNIFVVQFALNLNGTFGRSNIDLGLRTKTKTKNQNQKIRMYSKQINRHDGFSHSNNFAFVQTNGI